MKRQTNSVAPACKGARPQPEATTAQERAVASGPAGLWTLRLGDCLDPGAGLPSLEAKSVDVTITDPPYGAQIERNFRTGPSGKTAALGIGTMDEGLARAVARELARVTKRWVVVFCDVELAGTWRTALEATGLVYLRTGAWVKPDACPQFTGDRPAAGFEAAIITHAPGRRRWNGGGSHGVWTYGIERRGRIHPTQKPLPLMETLVGLFSDPGELVLDAFAGSATTGVAALKLGRRFLGWEASERFFAGARDRLEAAARGEALPGPRRARGQVVGGSHP